MGIKNKENFRYHYNLEVSEGRCPCGPGSSPDFLEWAGTIDYINNIIIKYNIKSINDCPSGVFGNWAHLLSLGNVKYVGYDINDLAVARNKKEFPDIEFHELDLVNEPVPYADLIICRDCLFHLSNDFGVKIVNNFKTSGAKYLLSTEHRWLKENPDLVEKELENEAGFRLINLEIPPFNLGEPIEIHEEKVLDYYSVGNNRQMSLWQLN